MDDTKARNELGEEIIASCLAISKGHTMRNATSAAGFAVGGIIGAAAATVAAKKFGKDGPEGTSPGGHRGNVYIVAGPTQIAFLEQKQGLIKASLGKVLARHARSEVTAIELAPGSLGMTTFTVRFQDGSSYVLDVARVQRGKAERFRDAVAGAQEQAA